MLRGCCDALLQQLQQKMSRETGKSKKKQSVTQMGFTTLE